MIAIGEFSRTNDLSIHRYEQRRRDCVRRILKVGGSLAPNSPPRPRRPATLASFPQLSKPTQGSATTPSAAFLAMSDPGEPQKSERRANQGQRVISGRITHLTSRKYNAFSIFLAIEGLCVITRAMKRLRRFTYTSILHLTPPQQLQRNEPTCLSQHANTYIRATRTP